MELASCNPSGTKNMEVVPAFLKKKKTLCTLRSIWKVLKCGAGEEWRRSVGPIV
jgi:hypothetical protein